MSNSRLIEISETISTEILNSAKRQRRLQFHRFNSLKNSVKKLIADSVSIRFSNSRKNWASISKRPAHYSSSIYNKDLSYRIHVQLAYEGMCSLGYLKEEKRGASDGSIGRYRTKYSATPKLINKFKDIDKVTLPVICGLQQIGEPIRVQITERISKYETKKRLIEYQNTPEIDEMRANLHRINQAIASKWIDLELADDDFVALQAMMRSRKDRTGEDDRQLNLTRTQLYRVFNDLEFQTGGRFYGGWWQNIPKQFRRLVTIDGKRTVEADYSSLHPSILYADKELEPPEDAYSSILPHLPRGVAKQAFNAMINAEAPMAAQPRGMKLSEFGYRWQDVVRAMFERHVAIQDLFFTGAGMRLQLIDSQLAEKTMLSFINYPTPVPICQSMTASLCIVVTKWSLNKQWSIISKICLGLIST